MRKELITLTVQEHDRLLTIRRIMKREIRQKDGADLLGITDRQVRNLIRKVKEKYRDFKPKFAAEKLLRNERIKISDEKLRQIMIEKGLWRVHCRPRKVHQWRERKEYYGEMVQMDGSHHDWLEGRGPKLVLMGFVDDARNRFFGRFYDYEGVYPAMNGLECYIRWNGIPQSLYLDKHSTYKTTRQPSTDELLRGEQGRTQFEREALRPGDLHRPLPKNTKFKEIFCLKDQRTIHNGYFIRWKGKRYAIEEPMICSAL